MSPALPSRSLLAALLLLALASCQETATEAPWLTYPGLDGHYRFLPLLGTSHDPSSNASISCAGCHPGDSFTQPVCTTCHGQATTDGLHTYLNGPSAGQLLAGYEWTPPPPAAWRRPRCLECHPQGGIPDAGHHGFFPVADGTPHSRASLGRAAGAFCAACHGDPLDKANVATLACVTCHADASRVQAPLPGSHGNLLTLDSYPLVPAPRDCLRCHDGGQVDRIAAHGSKPGPAGFGRAGPWDGSAAECAVNPDGCKHGVAPSGAPTSCNVAQPPRWCVNCFTCHDARPPAFGGAGAGQPSRPWAQDWKIPATSANQTAATACRGCHGPQ